MSKDYKRPEPKPRGGGSGSLLVGILIGLVLGLGIALGVAWYINKMPSPFLGDRKAPPPKTDAAKSEKALPPKGEDKAAKAAEKPRFDFYKILPGEEIAVDKQRKDEGKKPVTTAVKERFFLQAGAFQNAADAENLKARLALIGVEAAIQATEVPEKGTWHRVRVGPYTSVEELNRVRDTLKQNGIQTALVKVRE